MVFRVSFVVFRVSFVVFRVSFVVFRVSFVAFYRVSFVTTPCFNRGQAVVKGLTAKVAHWGGVSRVRGHVTKCAFTMYARQGLHVT